MALNIEAPTSSDVRAGAFALEAEAFRHRFESAQRRF